MVERRELGGVGMAVVVVVGRHTDRQAGRHGWGCWQEGGKRVESATKCKSRSWWW